MDNEAVKVGNRRFHEKCLKDQENLKKCRELYIEYLQPSVVHAQLNKVIKTIIEDKKVSVNLLLFTIEYLIFHNIEINVPYSLYYKVTDYKILKDYNKPIINTNNLKIYS
jgi:hypothetical protein